MIGILKNWSESAEEELGERMRGMSQTRSASFLLFGLLILFSYMPDTVFTQSPPETSETAYVYPLGCKTAYHVVEPSREATASVGAVLLLHGQRYTSQTWLDLGTLAFLSNSGLRAFAIDLPSFGRSGHRIDRETDADYMAALLHELGLVGRGQKPVLVAPSMGGGKYGIPLLLDHSDLLAGFVPIAPVGATSIFSDIYEQLEDVPTLVVWGQNDRGGYKQSQALLRIPGSEPMMVPNAGHACYLEATDSFHARLATFALKVSSSSYRRQLSSAAEDKPGSLITALVDTAHTYVSKSDNGRNLVLGAAESFSKHDDIAAEGFTVAELKEKLRDIQESRTAIEL